MDLLIIGLISLLTALAFAGVTKIKAPIRRVKASISFIKEVPLKIKRPIFYSLKRILFKYRLHGII
ncbi:hypothetical protein LPE509_01129 [Legionella pneumophila subsp. pneumophila LPE509]|nr:hypothetical protein LPE509_01129 [Legionella pneumophila subsp. pneumophila LPE509]